MLFRAQFRSLRTLSNQFLEIDLRRPHVFHLLRTGNFALDGDGAAIVQLLKPSDDTREVYFTLADRNFLPELSWIRRPQPVLGMNPLHVWAKQFDSVNRIRLAVENQIGEVEVNALIVQPYVLNRPDQRAGSLLPGF